MLRAASVRLLLVRGWRVVEAAFSAGQPGELRSVRGLLRGASPLVLQPAQFLLRGLVVRRAVRGGSSAAACCRGARSRVRRVCARRARRGLRGVVPRAPRRLRAASRRVACPARARGVACVGLSIYGASRVAVRTAGSLPRGVGASRVAGGSSLLRDGRGRGRGVRCVALRVRLRVRRCCDAVVGGAPWRRVCARPVAGCARCRSLRVLAGLSAVPAAFVCGGPGVPRGAAEPVRRGVQRAVQPLRGVPRRAFGRAQLQRGSELRGGVVRRGARASRGCLGGLRGRRGRCGGVGLGRVVLYS